MLNKLFQSKEKDDKSFDQFLPSRYSTDTKTKTKKVQKKKLWPNHTYK